MAAKRRPLIAGNWKMNGLKKDVRGLAGGLAQRMKKKTGPAFEMLVCPPAPLVGPVVDALKGSGIAVGGQDCHAQASGAHTGDVSAELLKSMGCKYVIVGHSERRSDHGEDNADVKAKAAAAHAAGLIAIICIGETLKQREAGRTKKINKKQLANSLPEGANAKNTVIAYEPVWAIGTGKVATPEQAQEVHALIRAELAKRLGQAEADKMRILYGGSMKPANAKELLALADVDGGVIGGASLTVADFMGIAEAV